MDYDQLDLTYGSTMTGSGAVTDTIRYALGNTVSNQIFMAEHALTMFGWPSGCGLSSGSRTKSPWTKSPRTKSPRTKSPWTKSPQPKSPLTKIPPDKIPPDKIPPGNIPHDPAKPACNNQAQLSRDRSRTGQGTTGQGTGQGTGLRTAEGTVPLRVPYR